MTMARLVEPEWLDSLPADDLRAIHSRRDLRRLNAVMSQDRIMAGLLGGNVRRPGPMTLLEIGAGDGAFMLAVARRLGRESMPADVTLLDRQLLVTPAICEDYARLAWRIRAITADAFAYLSGCDAERFDVITANLFLHHFGDDQVAELMRLAAGRCHLFVACEPRRSTLASVACRLLGAIGCNDVTRHDAYASVRAGFRNRELSTLWPERQGWRLGETSRGLFTHAFWACRSDDRL
jgi:hypothetical protein